MLAANLSTTKRTCWVCDRTFPSGNKLHEHLNWSGHSVEVDWDSIPITSSEDAHPRSGVQQLSIGGNALRRQATCYTCRQTFESRNKLHRHLERYGHWTASPSEAILSTTESQSMLSEQRSVQIESRPPAWGTQPTTQQLAFRAPTAAAVNISSTVPQHNSLNVWQIKQHVADALFVDEPSDVELLGEGGQGLDVPLNTILTPQQRNHLRLKVSLDKVDTRRPTIGRLIDRLASRLDIADRSMVKLFVNHQPLQNEGKTLEREGAHSCWPPSIFWNSATSSQMPATAVFIEIQEAVRQCIVCLDQHPISDFPVMITSDCQHVSNICREGIQNTINAGLTERDWDKIRCPVPDCTAIFQHHDMRVHLSDKDFQRYDTIALRSHLSKNPNFHQCPRPGCPQGQIADGTIFNCTFCGGLFCIIHRSEWHTGETCQEYDDRISGRRTRREEVATVQTIERTTRQCPNSECRVRIEKDDGCDHMTCQQCKHQFCWLCLAPWGPIITYGNHRHKRNCRYWA